MSSEIMREIGIIVFSKIKTVKKVNTPSPNPDALYSIKYEYPFPLLVFHMILPIQQMRHKSSS